MGSIRFHEALMFSAVMLLATVMSVAETQRWHCPEPPTEPCVKQRARLSSQNGIPLTLWLVGTKRRLDVRNDVVPAYISKYLDMTSEDHSYIFGWFEVCPLEPDNPGHIRAVCVASATELVVQNLRTSRPPFRLLATWPKR